MMLSCLTVNVYRTGALAQRWFISGCRGRYRWTKGTKSLFGPWGHRLRSCRVGKIDGDIPAHLTDILPSRTGLWTTEIDEIENNDVRPLW